MRITDSLPKDDHLAMSGSCNLFTARLNNLSELSFGDNRVVRQFIYGSISLLIGQFGGYASVSEFQLFGIAFFQLATHDVFSDIGTSQRNDT